MSHKILAEENPHKIILRHAKGWQTYSAARIHISVVPNPGYDASVRSILNWTLENFDQVTLCLHDTIQRYNLMAQGLSAEHAYKKARENGDVWLKTNIFAPDVFIDVVRWDQLTHDDDYVKINKKVAELYATDAKFSACLDYDLNMFAERCRKRGEIFDRARIDLSRQFLLEEISAYVPLFQKTSAVDIHPGMRMKAMQLLLDGKGNFEFRDNLMVSIKTFDKSAAVEKSGHDHLKVVSL